MRTPYWIILLVAISITAWIYHVDDRGYPRSHDSIQLILVVGGFYTALFFSILAAIFYGITNIPLRRKGKSQD